LPPTERQAGAGDFAEVILAHAAGNDQQLVDVITRQRNGGRALGLFATVVALEALQALARRRQNPEQPRRRTMQEEIDETNRLVEELRDDHPQRR
jgi:hypothetical protein